MAIVLVEQYLRLRRGTRRPHRGDGPRPHRARRHPRRARRGRGPTLDDGVTPEPHGEHVRTTNHGSAPPSVPLCLPATTPASSGPSTRRQPSPPSPIVPAASRRLASSPPVTLRRSAAAAVFTGEPLPLHAASCNYAPVCLVCRFFFSTPNTLLTLAISPCRIKERALGAEVTCFLHGPKIVSLGV